MKTRSHMGISYEVWKGGHAWFWLIGDPRSERAAIGAAADEAGAVREACSSIEEIAARWEQDAAAPASAPGPARQSDPRSCAALRWNRALANLDRYLIRACGHAV